MKMKLICLLHILYINCVKPVNFLCEFNSIKKFLMLSLIPATGIIS